MTGSRSVSPLTLTIEVDTGRLEAVTRGASTALAGVLPSHRALLGAAAETEYDRSLAQVVATLQTHPRSWTAGHGSCCGGDDARGPTRTAGAGPAGGRGGRAAVLRSQPQDRPDRHRCLIAWES
jgi:hypothetical protein